MTNEKKTGPVEVIMPATLTDFVKSLREMIALGRDLMGVWNDISESLRHNRSKNAALNLDNLVFLPQGSRHHLVRLANGTGTPEDVNAIGEILDRSAAKVENSIDRLAQYRSELRKHFGMGATILLEEIVYGPVGKRQLRRVLSTLAESGATINGLRERVPELALLALGHIEKYNAQLVELDDLIQQMGRK